MHATDISRPVDWRWREAVRLAADSAAVSSCSDALICRAACYLRTRRLARTRQARARLDEKLPTFSTAQRIRFGRDDPRRTAIEVRLLAGFPPGLIAERAALKPAVAWTYAALFFDVGERIDSGDFVWTQVIGAPRGDDGQSARERKAMMWLAWLGGPLVADALLLPGWTADWILRREDVDEHLIQSTDALLTRALALAPLLSPVDGQQARQILRVRTSAIQKQTADRGDAGYRSYLENVNVFLEHLEPVVGRAGIPEDHTQKYYTSSVEPRVAEWAAIHSGEPVPELDERIASFRRPSRSGDEEREDAAPEEENDAE